jgi:hypothetical protein
MRAVGVFGLLALGVVLAVNGSPLLGDLACGQPQPETEKVRGNGVQVQSAVRLVTVQENGDAGNGDVGQTQGDQHHLPPREVKQAVAHPLDDRIQKSPIRQQHEFVFLRTPDFRQFLNFKFFS